MTIPKSLLLICAALNICAPYSVQANSLLAWHERNTTQSGVSVAAITLTSKDHPNTLASLNRTVKTGKDTSGALKNNLDVNEIQTGSAVTQAFVQQANTFVATQAQKSERLKAEADKKQTAADKETDPVRKQQLQSEANSYKQQSADTAADSAKWGTGGTYRQIATALTAAAGGNVTGGMNALVQGAAVNYLQSLGASEVKKLADSLKDKAGSETARAALHGILACGGAAAQGSDCGSAALGASAGSVLNTLMAGDPSKMTAAEKENRKNLVTSLVAGIAATAGSSNLAAASSAAQIETENNYLKQKSDSVPQKSEVQQYADARKGCASGNSRACQAKVDLETLSLSRDNQVANLCNGGADSCSAQIHDALANGGHLAWTSDGKMYVVSQESPPVLTAPNSPNPREGTFHQAASSNLSQSLPIAAVAVAPEVAATLGVGKVVTGAALGAGFDAAGQYIQMKPDEPFRPLQTVVAGTTGALAYPLTGNTVISGAFFGGATNAANTFLTNEIYGKNDSVWTAAALGFGFGGAGAAFGNVAQSFAASRLPSNINATYINSTLPLFQQTINFGIPNPYPAMIGAGVANTIGGIPSFIPLPEAGK